MGEKIETEQEMENKRQGDRGAVRLSLRKRHMESTEGEERKMENGKSGSLTVRDNLRQTGRQTGTKSLYVGFFFHAK